MIPRPNRIEGRDFYHGIGLQRPRSTRTRWINRRYMRGEIPEDPPFPRGYGFYYVPIDREVAYVNALYRDYDAEISSQIDADETLPTPLEAVNERRNVVGNIQTTREAYRYVNPRWRRVFETEEARAMNDNILLNQETSLHAPVNHPVDHNFIRSFDAVLAEAELRYLDSLNP